MVWQSVGFFCGDPSWVELDQSVISSHLSSPRSVMCVQWWRVNLSVPHPPLVSVHTSLCSVLQSFSRYNLRRVQAVLCKHHSGNSKGEPVSDTPCPKFLLLESDLERPLHSWALRWLAPIHQEVAVVPSGLERKEEQKKRSCGLAVCLSRRLWVFLSVYIPTKYKWWWMTYYYPAQQRKFPRLWFGFVKACVCVHVCASACMRVCKLYICKFVWVCI